MQRTALFHTRRAKLRRTRVPAHENLTALVVVGLLAALVAWIVATRDAFDPRERDLPMELLYQERPAIEIYNRPLQLWAEPGQTATAVPQLGAFPQAVVDAQWRPAGRLRQFDADTLYEKINGEAEKFIKQGFVRLDYLLLRATADGAELALELFDQGDLGGSLGVFAEHAAGREVEAREGVSFFFTSAGVVGRKQQYFFRVAGDRRSDAVQAKAAQLVTAFAALGKGGEDAASTEPPWAFRLLRDGLGIAESHIQFQEQNVFQYDFAERFWFADAGIDGKARLFLHVAADAFRAQALVEALLAEQGYEYEVVATAARPTFRHSHLGTYFILERRGPYVYGLERLADPAAAETVLTQLEGQLGDA